MSSYLTPEDGPFVFGAFASLFQRTEQHDPIPVTPELNPTVPEDGEDATVVRQIAS
jgi:hypothetical protein